MMFVLPIPPMHIADWVCCCHCCMSGRRPLPGPDEENPEEEELDGLWVNGNALEHWDVQAGIPDGDVNGEIQLGSEPCYGCC